MCPAVLFALFDGEVLIGEGGDLRQVSDAEDLLGAGEGFELLADSFGGAALRCRCRFRRRRACAAWFSF
ncbi:MAG: hypothetical protein WDM87_13350 [Terracidiphilus sp.]